MKFEKVLIVDDEPENLEALKRLVGKVLPGAQIVNAADGLMAFQKARNESFSLIITDYKMPKLNGAKLVNSLRDNEYNKKTHMVVLSGYVEEAQEECKHFKLKDVLFLDKPIDTATFSEQVTAFMAAEKQTTSTFVKRPENLSLDVNFINPFLTAINDTLGSLGGMKNLTKTGSRAFTVDNLVGLLDVNALIDIDSMFFQGSLGIHFAEKTYLGMLEKMLSEKHERATEENKDAAGEIVNIVLGQAKRTLNELGYAIVAKLPQISLTKINSDKQYSAGIIVDYNSDLGRFSVSIRLNA